MMAWRELIAFRGGFEIIAAEKMISRRNEVFLIRGGMPAGGEKQFIVKIHRNGHAGREADILNKLRGGGINVPPVIWSDHRHILMPYIDGILLEQLVQGDHGSSRIWIKKLAQWLASLHAYRVEDGCVFCMPDLNLRNFILSGGEFFGLDFEAVHLDRPERDLGGLAAFILNNHPMFTAEKWLMARELIDSYCLEAAKALNNRIIDRDLISRFFYQEMTAAAGRRQAQGAELLAEISAFDGKCLF